MEHTFRTNKSDIHFKQFQAVQAVTTTQSAIEPVNPSLSDDQSTGDEVNIESLRHFYQFWATSCILMMVFVLLVFTWAKITGKNRRKSAKRNIDPNFKNSYLTKSLI